jgi:hypothetical protein
MFTSSLLDASRAVAALVAMVAMVAMGPETARAPTKEAAGRTVPMAGPRSIHA